MFVVKVQGLKRNKSGKLGKLTLLGYCQLDLGKYVNTKNQKVLLELQKCKVDSATLEMNITIASHKDMDDQEQFNKDLEK